jgi:hypothetical protein
MGRTAWSSARLDEAEVGINTSQSKQRLDRETKRFERRKVAKTRGEAGNKRIFVVQSEKKKRWFKAKLFGLHTATRAQRPPNLIVSLVDQLFIADFPQNEQATDTQTNSRPFLDLAWGSLDRVSSCRKQESGAKKHIAFPEYRILHHTTGACAGSASCGCSRITRAFRPTQRYGVSTGQAVSVFDACSWSIPQDPPPPLRQKQKQKLLFEPGHSKRYHAWRQVPHRLCQSPMGPNASQRERPCSFKLIQ